MNKKLNEFYSQINRLYDGKELLDLETYLFAKLSEEMASDGTDSILISVLNELATFYRGQNQPEKSIEYLQMAADVTKDMIGKDSQEYATLLMNLSAAYRINKNGRAAVDLADRAADILKGLGEAHLYFYCAAINNKGMAYLSLKESEKARECFEETIEIFSDLGFDDDPDTEAVCVSMINIAHTYYDEKRFTEALEYCRNILKKYDRINQNRWDHLYALYTLMGDIYRNLQQDEEAAEAYRKAMNLVDEASGQNFEYRDIKVKLEMITDDERA